MMFTISEAVAAGATVNALRNWTLRQPPTAGVLELLVDAAAVGLTMNVTTGTESIVQVDSIVGAGGAAGVLPNRLDNEPIVDKVAAGDELVLNIRNPTAGAITYNAVAIWTPAAS